MNQNEVKRMMGAALMAVGVEAFLRSFIRIIINEIDFCLNPEIEIVDALKRLEDQPPVQGLEDINIADRIWTFRMQAAALCYLAYFSRPGQGIRASMLPGKGKPCVRAVKVAGFELQKAAGVRVSPFAIADASGIRIGSRDDARKLPPLPIGTLREQRILAREGIRTTMGIEGQYPFRPVSIAGPLEYWVKALEEIDKKIRESQAN